VLWWIFSCLFADTTILSVCELHRRQAIDQSASGHVIGTFVPRCTDDGHFEPLQCHSSTGDCWCVDGKEGLELIGSRQRVPSMPDCTRFTGKTCWILWSEWIWIGPTVFRELRNFEPSRGIWPLPRNFRVSAEFHRIPRKHGNSAATAKFRKSVLLL